MDGEPPAQRRCERCQAVRGRGHPQQPDTHGVADASWHAVFEEPRSAAFDCHDPLVLETTEELDQEERISLDSIGFAQEIIIGLSAQDVHGDLRDSLTPERAEPDHLGPRVFQLVLSALQQGRALVRAEGHHPADRQGGKLFR
jgi:hypothetical protein